MTAQIATRRKRESNALARTVGLAVRPNDIRRRTRVVPVAADQLLAAALRHCTERGRYYSVIVATPVARRLLAARRKLR